MPDQFSKEYIAYILSDEAEGLQDAMGWAKKGGWVSINGKPELVTEVDDYVATYKAKGTWRGQGELPKLPVLHDLLEIIEGAGRGYTLTHSDGYCLEDHEARNAVAGPDIMVRFAKLAVRALTNRE